MSCASPGTSSPHQSPAAKLPAWLCSDLFPLYLVSAEAANKPESPEGPTSTGCWFAPDGCAATDTEIYLLAALFVVGTEDEKKEREWADQVLAEEARAMRLQAAGDVWRPVHNWQGNTNGFALKSMLTKSSRTVEVVIELVKSTTGRRLLDADVTMYLEKLRMEKLTGPTWTKKRKGSARHIAALISVARVVFDKGGALRRVLVAQREQPCAASPTKEEAVAAHMMEMAALALVHGIEVETLRETIEELDGLVVCARDRAQAYRRQRCKAVERKQAATSTSNERWKAKLADMKGAWKAAAIEDVEAAHGSAMVRLKELKAQAHAAKRAALAAASKAEKLSGVRLASAKAADELASELQTRVHDLEDALHESAADAIEKLNQIRELKVVGSGHGHSRWWPWWVRAMIMEQLVNGTPPTAIPRNIACDAAYLVPFLEVKVPNVQLCRRMRGELRIVTETLAAFRIGKAVNWRQLFTDGTSRRQTALLTAIIAIDGPDGELVPIVVRGAFVATGETSEQQVDDILERALARGAAKLTRLREVFEELFPGVPHDIPAANEIDISKLGNGGAVCSDNCNPAMKVKRLLKAEIQAAVEAKYDAAAWAALSEEEKAAKRLVLEIDCWNHLRNTWLGAVTSALTGRLKENLKEEIDAIDFRLRVGTDMVMVLRAADKEFSLCANYPKGHGDLFREWMQRVHPKALLLHVIRTAGSRQDLAFDGSRALYLNRRYWVEFLDERLRVPSASNILQECLYVLLTSVEMVASARIHSIINLAIVLPMRWLAGKTHTLAAFDWSERSMGRAVKLLEIALVKIGENAKLVLDESFMMHIFDELSNELPPFQEYLAYMYDEKKMAMAGSSITEHQYRRLRDELFNPMDADNVDSTDAALELGALAASTMLIELRDPKKATSRHLDGELSWGNTSLEEHAAALRKMGVNDPAESIFGAVTRELMVYGRIGFGAASGIATARRNRDFARGISKEKRKSSKKGSAAKLESTGLFHSISIEMREALITMAARDNRSELAIDRADLESQRAARRCKEELASEKGRESASESYIDALYYFEMWGSAACWKTTTKADEEYAKLTSKSAQLEALKEQIRIRVEGLGWSELSCAWSKNGVQFLPDELMKHLKMLLAEQAKRPIPLKPPVAGLARKELPVLGKRTADVAALDAKEASNSWALEAAARATKAQREAKGIGDSYQQRQGSKPEIDERLVGKRIEVVIHYTLPDGVFGEALMWCSGEVVDVDPRPYVTFPKGKSATIKWDANDRVQPAEPVSTSATKLLPSRWNKDGVGAWRMDLDPPPVAVSAPPVPAPLS